MFLSLFNNATKPGRRLTIPPTKGAKTMKTFKALFARALEIKNRAELDALCGDIERAFQSDKIKPDENELLYRLINKLYKDM